MVLLVGCELYQQKDPGYYHNPTSDFGYDLSQPTKKYFMGFELEEISGLSWYRPGRLACVQDEDGTLYIYDLVDEEVTQRIKFAGSGDYEGVEIIDYQAYIIKNSGELYTFPVGREDDVDTEIIKTKLKSVNNVEGLGFDVNRKKLLLACKASGDLGERKVKGKAIYGLGLDSKKIGKAPLASVTKKQLREILSETTEEVEAVDFGPSGIAVHPKEKRYYLVSYVGHLMVILDPELNLEDVIRLNPKIFRQPEGICFSPDGTMYISSEGAGGNGYILEFAYQPRTIEGDSTL